MITPLIVKVGGSLFDQIAQITEVLKTQEKPVIIIPGGGKFTELVRKTGSSGTSGHWMAICGMEQYGWYISSFGLLKRFDLNYSDNLSVLLPYALLLKEDPLPHSWEVTSDTIAAWVADKLGAELILLKSKDGITKGGILVDLLFQPFNCEEVDASFLNFVFSHKISTRIVNGRHPDRIYAAIKGEACIGTRIIPTF